MNDHTVEQSASILAAALAIEREEGATMAQAIVEAERRWREREQPEERPKVR